MPSYRKLAMRVLGRPLHTGGSDSPRPASQRAAAFILTAIMLTSLTAPAFAGTWYIENGDITVKASGTEGKNKVSQGNNPEVEDTDTVITNQNKDTASSHTVTIEAKEETDKVEVTLDNVNIKTTGGKAAVSVTGSGDTTIKLDGDNHLTGGSDDYSGSGISSSGSLTISGGKVTANGGNGSKYSTRSNGGSGIDSGSLSVSDGTVTATGGDGGGGDYSDGGSGIYSGSGGVTISDGTVTATGGKSGIDSNGGRGIYSSGSLSISGSTVTATAGSSSGSYGRDGITCVGQDSRLTISGGTVTANGGSGSYRGGSGISSSSDIDLSGSLELTATAGKGTRSNGKALSQKGSELNLDAIKDKLDPGANIVTKDADGSVIDQVSIPRPVEPEESSSSSGGGSADASVQESVFPGLVVTDKDGQRISYTSTQSGNTLTVRVGRLTASFRISLAALRQLRAEGIDTITFQTILCSTTLSVDELLAMGGEDAEAVLTHRLTDSSLTVG